jgi:hypothetical protein
MGQKSDENERRRISHPQPPEPAVWRWEEFSNSLWYLSWCELHRVTNRVTRTLSFDLWLAPIPLLRIEVGNKDIKVVVVFWP